MKISYIFFSGAVLWISLGFAFLRLANADHSVEKTASKSISNPTASFKTKGSRKVDANTLEKIDEKTARYAFNFDPLQNTPASGNSSNPGTMGASAVVDMMSHIRDPFKHSVTSAVVASLYIVALISLIVFATTGTVAFICSFADCRNFFMGMKPEGTGRPYPGVGGGPLFLKRRDNTQYFWNGMQPVVQSLHESLDKYGNM